MLKKTKSKNEKYINQNGFTLIEVVVCIGIMIILGSVVTPLLIKNLSKAHVARSVAEIKNIKAAARSAYIKDVIGTNASVDYLNHLVRAGFLDRNVTENDLIQSMQLKYDPVSEYYYINATLASVEGMKVIEQVDQLFDNEINGSSGLVTY